MANSPNDPRHPEPDEKGQPPSPDPAAQQPAEQAPTKPADQPPPPAGGSDADIIIAGPAGPPAVNLSDSAVDLGLPGGPYSQGSSDQPVDLSGVSVIEWAALVEEPPPASSTSQPTFDAPSDADLRGQAPPGGADSTSSENLAALLAGYQPPPPPPAEPGAAEVILTGEPTFGSSDHIFDATVSSASDSGGPPGPPPDTTDTSAVDLGALPKLSLDSSASSTPFAELVEEDAVLAEMVGDSGVDLAAPPSDAPRSKPPSGKKGDSGIDLLAEVVEEPPATGPKAGGEAPGESGIDLSEEAELIAEPPAPKPAAGRGDSGIDLSGESILAEDGPPTRPTPPPGMIVESGIDLVAVDSIEDLPPGARPAPPPKAATGDSGVKLVARDVVLEDTGRHRRPLVESGIDLVTEDEVEDLPAARPPAKGGDSGIDLAAAAPAGTAPPAPTPPARAGDSGIDLLGADLVEDVPPAAPPPPQVTAGGDSGVDLASEDLVLESDAGKGSGSKLDSGRDLIAEAVESGVDLLPSSSRSRKPPSGELDALELDRVTPDDESSAVGLGSRPAMPAADQVLGTPGSRKPKGDPGVKRERADEEVPLGELPADEGSPSGAADSGIDLLAESASGSGSRKASDSGVDLLGEASPDEPPSKKRNKGDSGMDLGAEGLVLEEIGSGKGKKGDSGVELTGAEGLVLEETAGKKRSDSDIDLLGAEGGEGSAARRDESGIDIETEGSSAVLGGAVGAVDESGIDLETESAVGLPAGKRRTIEPAKEPEEREPAPVEQKSRVPALLGGTALGMMLGVGSCVALLMTGVVPEEYRFWAGKPTGAPSSQPQAAPFQQKRAYLDSGDLEGAKQAGIEQIDEAKPEERVARARYSWLSYLREQGAQDKQPPFKEGAKDPAVPKALADLNEAVRARDADALALRAQIHELTGNVDKARADYQTGIKDFQADPEQKERFETALLALGLRTRRAGALAPALRRLDLRVSADRALLLAALMALQAPPAGGAPAPPAGRATPEAGFRFWQAVKAAEGGKYSEALAALEEARARHARRRLTHAGKPQNPLSDPTEEIFLRACAELKAAWELRARLRNPDYLAAKPAERVKEVDALLEKARAAQVKELAKELALEDKPVTKPEELVEAIKAERTAAAEENKKLEKAVAARDKKIDGLETAVADKDKEIKGLTKDRHDARALAKEADGKLEASLAREASLDRSLKDIAGALKVKYADPKTDTSRLVKAARRTAQIAAMTGRACSVARLMDQVEGLNGQIRGLNNQIARERELHAQRLAARDEAQAAALAAEKSRHGAERAGLQRELTRRWTPERMLAIWVPVLERGRGQGALAEDALVDAERVERWPGSTRVQKGKAHLVRGLALRNQEQYAEARKEVDRARAALKGAAGDWARRADRAWEDLADPAAWYLREADRLNSQGQWSWAVVVLTRGLEKVPAGRARLLARRSLITLEAARARGPLTANSEAVKKARRDALEAADAKLAEGSYAAGRVAEVLGEWPAAVRNYEKAAGAASRADANRYEIALYRARLRAGVAARPVGRAPEAPRAPRGLAPAGLKSLSLVALLMATGVDAGGLAGLPTKDQKEALALADKILEMGDKVPFDVRAQALALKGLYTRGLLVYIAGLGERGLLAPEHANALLDLVRNNPVLRRPDYRMIPDPMEAERHYAAGLNFYFGRNYANAEKELVAAVENDNSDARYFYFLGLARLAQGNRDGYEDLDQGARLERQGRPDRAAVSAALERIQGPLRRTVNAVRTRPVKERAR